MATDVKEQEIVGARLDPVKVTRQEELQFGMDYAPMMRRLGQAAALAEQALFQAERLCGSSESADSFTGGERDDAGRSEHTAWLASIAERLAALRTTANGLLADVGVECIQREQSWRTTEPEVGG